MDYPRKIEPNIMNKFPKKVIIYLALTMDINVLKGWCRNSIKFNDSVCENPDFWVLRKQLNL